MKKALLLPLILLLTYFKSPAQEPVIINISATDYTITVNGTTFSAKSTQEDFEKALGKPDRVAQMAGVDAIFAYDQKGFAFTVHPINKTLKYFFITYIYDGDKKVAKETFTGQLSINGEIVTQQTPIDQISKYSNAEFKELMTGIYMAEKDRIGVVVEYKGTPASLAQLGIEYLPFFEFYRSRWMLAADSVY